MAKSLDPKALAREANADAAKLATKPPATAPAAAAPSADEAVKPTKPTGPVVIGPAATTTPRPAAAEPAADKPVEAASPAVPAAATADPARKTGS
jgi:hypothetical protein